MPTVRAENFNILPLKLLSDLSISNLYNENKENSIKKINKE